jgi:hypothetical protein
MSIERSVVAARTDHSVLARRSTMADVQAAQP